MNTCLRDYYWQRSVHKSHSINNSIQLLTVGNKILYCWVVIRCASNRVGDQVDKKRKIVQGSIYFFHSFSVHLLAIRETKINFWTLSDVISTVRMTPQNISSLTSKMNGKTTWTNIIHTQINLVKMFLSHASRLFVTLLRMSNGFYESHGW